MYWSILGTVRHVFWCCSWSNIACILSQPQTRKILISCPIIKMLLTLNSPTCCIWICSIKPWNEMQQVSDVLISSILRQFIGQFFRCHRKWHQMRHLPKQICHTRVGIALEFNFAPRSRSQYQSSTPLSMKPPALNSVHHGTFRYNLTEMLTRCLLVSGICCDDSCRNRDEKRCWQPEG